MIGLKASQGLVDLCQRSLAIATINLRHQKCFLAIAVAERLSHANLALTAVIVPAVVEEVYAVVECRADNPNAFAFFTLTTDVRTAQADHRNLLTGFA